MTKKDNIKEKIPGADGDPFKVPEGYFENFESRLADRISSETIEEKKVKRISLRPYLALAASISGIALITFMILQFVVSNNYNNDDYYDLALLEEYGIAIDEATISDSYESEAMDEDTSWEQEAMDYLASNEVGLEYLLAMN